MSHTSSPDYKLRIYDESGVAQDEINDFLALEYMKQRNNVGFLRVDLPPDHRLIEFLERDWQVKVLFRHEPGVGDWETDFEGLFRSQRRARDYRGVRTYTAWFTTSLDWLQRSIVAFYADTNGKNSFTAQKPETIAKEIVKYNATTSATTANGRLRTLDSWKSFITIEADAASGTNTDYKCAWKNTLEAVQGIAEIANADFDLVKTGPVAWQFRWYPNGIGGDVSATVLFSMDRHNMESPELELLDHVPTIAIAAGEGQENDRKISIQSHISLEGNHHAREIYVEARNFNSTGGLAVAAANKLTEAHRLASRLNFQMLQVPNTVYREHYFLGSRVTASFEGFTSVKRIDKATVALSPRDSGGDRMENITFELTDHEG